jgi:Lon-like ATP-dependent protease
MVSNGHSSSHPQVLVVPLDRLPLLPGIHLKVTLYDERLVAEIVEMKQRGQAYVGAFLKRARDADGNFTHKAKTAAAATAVTDDDDVNAGVGDTLKQDGEAVNWDPSDDMYDIGTFAQVQSIVRPRIGDIDRDEEKDSSGEDSSGSGVTLLLLGHRRLKKTHTVRSDPMVVRVEHLKDPKGAGGDDVLKATVNEVIATMRDLLKINPLAKDTLMYYAQSVNDFQNPATVADLAASMASTTAEREEMQEILETLDVRERLEASLLLLKKEVELAKLQATIKGRVEEKISGDQRRYMLLVGGWHGGGTGFNATCRLGPQP